MLRFSFFLVGWLILPPNLPAQGNEKTWSVHFQPVFQKKNVRLIEPFQTAGGDSLALHTLRFYLSNFVFMKNGAAVFGEKNSHHLLDLETENSLNLKFELPENLQFDSLTFDLGIDSLTHISGAIGGDLDPTRGMFWTWQSGYINFKIEGFFERSTARNHEFQFHLGGYLAPFQSVQPIKLPVFSTEYAELRLDLTPFFEKADWLKKPEIMSPGNEAVRLSKILATSFRIDEK